MRDRDMLDLLDLTYASEEGLSAYLSRVLDRCTEWFAAEGATIFLREGREYRVAMRSGAESRASDQAVIVEGKGIAGTCIQSRQPLLVNDPDEHPLLAGKVGYKRSDRYTAMVVPLTMPGGEVVGVLNVSRLLAKQAFDENDLRLARTLANNVALAVSNAVLVDRVTDALDSERRLRQELKSVIENAGVAILVADECGRLTEWNGTARDLAAPKEQSLSAYVASAPRGLRAVLSEAGEAALAGQEHQDRAHDDALRKSWSVVASPMPSGGATIVIQDVTEHEAALQELDRVRRLAEIGQMTAAIAHEIRNPLASVCSAAQLVQSDPSSAIEFGAIIESEALKLNELCEEFLAFAKPVALELKPVRLNELVGGVARGHSREFESAEVDLALELDPSDPIVMADSFRMEQACRNLILNALQASSRGGQVRVKVEGVGFTVEDSGHGMDRATAERLFTPFFTTKPKGTGLGLSNVKKIIDAHRGSIQMDTAPDRGTSFSVRLERRSA